MENEASGQALENKIEETVNRKLKEALDEREDRDKRKCNIVVTNIPESRKEEAEERRKDDTKFVTNQSHSRTKRGFYFFLTTR